MTLYRLDASIRREGSHSRALADLVEQEWLEAHPHDTVVRRDVGLAPIPATAWSAAVTAGFVGEDDRTPEQRDATSLATTLVDEMAGADALLFAVPLYNFGVAQQFKAFVDLVMTDPRMASGSTTVVDGRPAVLATVRGGAYGEGTPREGWDHATPWMRRILGELWGLDLRVVEEEFALVGVNPALDQFRDLAAQLRVASHALATEHGRALAGELRRAG